MVSQYFIRRGEKIVGPTTLDQLKTNIAKGNILASDEVSQKQAGPWQKLSSVPELASLFSGFASVIPHPDASQVTQNPLEMLPKPVGGPAQSGLGRSPEASDTSLPPSINPEESGRISGPVSRRSVRRKKKVNITPKSVWLSCAMLFGFCVVIFLIYSTQHRDEFLFTTKQQQDLKPSSEQKGDADMPPAFVLKEIYEYALGKTPGALKESRDWREGVKNTDADYNLTIVEPYKITGGALGRIEYRLVNSDELAHVNILRLDDLDFDYDKTQDSGTLSWVITNGLAGGKQYRLKFTTRIAVEDGSYRVLKITGQGDDGKGGWQDATAVDGKAQGSGWIMRMAYELLPVYVNR